MARVSVIGLLALVAWRQTLECPVFFSWILVSPVAPPGWKTAFCIILLYFVNDVLDPFVVGRSIAVEHHTAWLLNICGPPWSWWSWIQGAWMQSWVQAGGQDDWLPPPLVCADLAIIWSFEFKSSSSIMYWYVLYRKSMKKFLFDQPPFGPTTQDCLYIWIRPFRKPGTGQIQHDTTS